MGNCWLPKLTHACKLAMQPNCSVTDRSSDESRSDDIMSTEHM